MPNLQRGVSLYYLYGVADQASLEVMGDEVWTDQEVEDIHDFFKNMIEAKHSTTVVINTAARYDQIPIVP